MTSDSNAGMAPILLLLSVSRQGFVVVLNSMIIRPLYGQRVQEHRVLVNYYDTSIYKGKLQIYTHAIQRFIYKKIMIHAAPSPNQFRRAF